MADEYINRAKFCEYLRTRKAESADDYGRGWKNGIIATEKAARGFPAADVALVIHAHWVQTSKGVIYCSNCGAVCGIGAHIVAPLIPVTDDLTMEIYVMVFNALKKAEEQGKGEQHK